MQTLDMEASRVAFTRTTHRDFPTTTHKYIPLSYNHTCRRLPKRRNLQQRETLSPKASLKAMASIEAAITEGDRPNKVSPHLTAHVILRSSSPLTALAEAQDHDHERYSKRRDDAIDGCLRHV